MEDADTGSAHSVSRPALVVLGSGTAVPRRDRGTSCYIVAAGDAAFLIDLGPGALHRAACAGYDLDALDAILVTHIHPDHCTDLISLQFALRNPGPRAGREPLGVWGHSSVEDQARRFREAFPGWLDAPPGRWDFHAVTPQAGSLWHGTLPGGHRLVAGCVAHHASSVGYRLELREGPIVAFSGDATEGGDLVELARGADVFVLEAAGSDRDPIEGHLTPRRAGALARAAGVGRLVLTHFYPDVLNDPIAAQARETFEGPITLAQDGWVHPLMS